MVVIRVTAIYRAENDSLFSTARINTATLQLCVYIYYRTHPARAMGTFVTHE